MNEKIKSFLKTVYQKLISIKDSPHRIAGGFAVGVFFGVLPAAGPLAAVVLAWILRVNKVAAFVGGLLTNTWLSVITFVLAIKVGAFLTGTGYDELYRRCKDLMKNFNWREIFNESILNILKPLFVGYAVVGLAAGLLAYAGAMFIVLRRKRRAARAIARQASANKSQENK